jgi:hypothetical protein
MIKDTFPERGIFISRGAGTYGNELGLQPYLVTQGFVRKLLPEAVKESKGVFNLSGFGWFDYDTTQKLWDTVYQGKAALMKQGRWIDPSSSSIPFTYLLTAAATGEGRNRSGDSAGAARRYSEARDIARVTGMESVLQPADPAPSGDTPGRD